MTQSLNLHIAMYLEKYTFVVSWAHDIHITSESDHVMVVERSYPLSQSSEATIGTAADTVNWDIIDAKLEFSAVISASSIFALVPEKYNQQIYLLDTPHIVFHFIIVSYEL